MIELQSYNYEDTLKIGKELGRLLLPGDVICLDGDLGAGKTAFTNGIARALNIEGYVTSPTFTIVNEYYGKYPLYHFDVYRIGDPEEILDIGFEEYVSGEGITVIEWSEMIKDILPDNRINVKIRCISENERIIEIDCKNNELLLEKLKRNLKG